MIISHDFSILSVIDCNKKLKNNLYEFLRKFSWEFKKHAESVMIWKRLPLRLFDDSDTNFPIHYTFRLLLSPMIVNFKKKMIHALRTESCFTYKIEKIGHIVVVRTISTPKNMPFFQQLMQFVLVNAILHFSDIPATTLKNCAASWERKKSDFRKKKLIFDVLKFWPNSMSSNIWIR